jgi:hypothetical protein
LQYFTKGFSKAYLEEYLPKNGRYVLVFDKNQNQLADVKMKMGKDKRAIITSHWQDVVKKMKMKEDGVYMFWFRRTKNFLGKSLKLIVEQVK